MRDGTIYSCYSFKGGAGRTFALANIASLLSKWGYRVLCIDWDLEAPGLHQYFSPFLGPKVKTGLVDWFTAVAAGTSTSWRDHVTEIRPYFSQEPISLLLAGEVQDSQYVQRMQNLNWEVLFAQHNLGQTLEQARTEWKQDYDIILIDSRTGYSDAGSICTIHLPDILVLFCSTNYQSLQGTVQIARRAREQRNKLPVDRGMLPVLPIASRLEGRVEYALVQAWRQRLAESLRPFYEEWVHKDVSVSAQQLLNYTYIPYVPYWNFGEGLAVLEEDSQNPDSISYAYEVIAALIARRLGGTEVLARDRERYIREAREHQDAPRVAPQSSQVAAVFQTPGAPYDPAWHVARIKEERKAWDFLRSGQPVVIWGPKLFGKSWLLEHLIHEARRQDVNGVRVLRVNLSHINWSMAKDENGFLQQLGALLADSMGIGYELIDSHLRLPGTPRSRLSTLFEELVLKHVPQVLLCIDRADAVLGRSPLEHFLFETLRSWAERFGERSWSRLRLLLGISNEPAEIVRLTASAFFNRATIRLDDFTDEQLELLCTFHRIRLTAGEMKAAQVLIGGHPYLWRQLLYSAATTGESIEALLQPGAATFANFLGECKTQPKLIEMLKAYLNGRTIDPQKAVDYFAFMRAGLVCEDRQGHRRLRYALYDRLI